MTIFITDLVLAFVFVCSTSTMELTSFKDKHPTITTTIQDVLFIVLVVLNYLPQQLIFLCMIYFGIICMNSSTKWISITAKVIGLLGCVFGAWTMASTGEKTYLSMIISTGVIALIESLLMSLLIIKKTWKKILWIIVGTFVHGFMLFGFLRNFPFTLGMPILIIGQDCVIADCHRTLNKCLLFAGIALVVGGISGGVLS